MMATKDDSKGSDGERSTPVDSPARRRRAPRLESASELRGFPVSAGGTALGVGGAAGGGASDPDSYYDDDEPFSAEESQKIEELLEFIDEDARGRPPPAPREHAVSLRARTEVRRSPGRSDEGPIEQETTAPAQPRDGRPARGWVFWGCVGLGAMIGVGVPVVMLGRPSPSVTVVERTALPSPAPSPVTSSKLTPTGVREALVASDDAGVWSSTGSSAPRPRPRPTTFAAPTMPAPTAPPSAAPSALAPPTDMMDTR